MPAVSQIRTHLGVSQSKTALSTWTAQTGLVVSAGATLLVMVAHDPSSVTNVIWGGVSLTKNVSGVNPGNAEGSIWTLLSNPTSQAATLTISWPGVQVTAKAAVAAQITGVNTFYNGRTGGASNAVTVVSTGSMANVSALHYLQAMVAMEGPNGNVSGVWQTDANVSGAFWGTSGGGAATNISLRDGYAVSLASATRSARLSVFTAADCVALLGVYIWVPPSATANPTPANILATIPAPTTRTTRTIIPGVVQVLLQVPAPVVTNAIGAQTAQPMPPAIEARIPAPTVTQVFLARPTPPVIEARIPAPAMTPVAFARPAPAVIEARVPAPGAGSVATLRPIPPVIEARVPTPVVTEVGGGRKPLSRRRPSSRSAPWLPS